MEVHAAMKDSRTFPLVLNLAVLFVTILYLSFGSLAYLFFGEDTSDNLIGVNLSGVAADVLRISLSAVLMIAYPLQMFPVVKICEKYLFGEMEITLGDTIKRNSFRVLVVCITVVAAMVIPYFGLFSSLVKYKIKRKHFWFNDIKIN